MASPFSKVEIRAGAYPLLETRTELIANGTISSVFVDTIDMIPVRRSALGPGDSTSNQAYTMRPNVRGADIRHMVHWCCHAQGAGGIAAPGELVLRGCIIDPAVPGTPTSEIYTIKRIVISGKPFKFQTGSGSNDYMLTGQFVCSSRLLSVNYYNASVAQTLFALGVYVRAL